MRVQLQLLSLLPPQPHPQPYFFRRLPTLLRHQGLLRRDLSSVHSACCQVCESFTGAESWLQLHGKVSLAKRLQSAAVGCVAKHATPFAFPLLIILWNAGFSCSLTPSFLRCELHRAVKSASCALICLQPCQSNPHLMPEINVMAHANPKLVCFLSHAGSVQASEHFILELGLAPHLCTFINT